MKNTINFIIMSICLVAAMIKAGATGIHTPDSMICLVLEGKLTNNFEDEDRSCSITITRVNAQPEELTIRNSNRNFRTYLRKNTSYTITISKAGYESKTILVDTRIHNMKDDRHRFFFEATLKAEGSGTSATTKETCPVAFIYFDKRKGSFSYNRYNRCPATHLAGN
jgi:hypothetical protein